MDEMNETPVAPKVKIVTLGCAKNEVDSEEIAGVLSSAGYHLDAHSPRTDVTVINTCGFLESAKEESIAAIKEAVALKKKGKTGKVIVAGCLAQRLGEELQRLAPGADAYVGVGQMGRFDEIVGESLKTGPKLIVEPPHHRWANVGTRLRTGPGASAYLKLSEGCDHQCTFCTIPSFRGKHQSKPLERILDEARSLAESGAIELNLIAQDVTQYGFDLYQKFMLPELLRKLNEVDGVRWIRMLYFYPNRLTDEVIETMASLPKVLPYIDIPLQHTHPDVLRRMKRPWDGDRYLALFEKVRAALPDVAIRTTFIVGFPGETEAEFKHMLDFVSAARLDRVGAFLFSREPGTPSYDMADQVGFRVKQTRYDKLMRLQQGISLEKNEAWVGRSLEVLIESRQGDWRIGRSFRDAPEIDGLVYVHGAGEIGEIVPATVIQAEPYDLYADGGVGASPAKKAGKTRVPVAPR